MTTRGTDWEARFVSDKRRLGASWQAISAMLGRSVDDVRRDYDRRPPAPPKPDPAPVGKHRQASRQFGEHVMLALYKSISPVSAESLGGKNAQNAVSELRRRHGPAIILTIPGAGYCLTNVGRDVYERHFASPQSSGVAS